MAIGSEDQVVIRIVGTRSALPSGMTGSFQTRTVLLIDGGDIHGPCLLEDLLPSTTYQSLQLLGIPRSLHRDLGSSAIDLTKVFRRKLDRRGADVLF